MKRCLCETILASPSAHVSLGLMIFIQLEELRVPVMPELPTSETPSVPGTCLLQQVLPLGPLLKLLDEPDSSPLLVATGRASRGWGSSPGDRRPCLSSLLIDRVVVEGDVVREVKGVDARQRRDRAKERARPI